MERIFSPRKRLFHQKKFRFLLLALLIISFSLGLVIVPFEKNVGNITNSYDGIWWAVTTLTTVGYGDYVPVTPGGRAIGILLQVLGTMMFGMVIAMISSYLARMQDEFYWRRHFERSDRLEQMIRDLVKRTDFLVKDNQSRVKEKPDSTHTS